MRKSAELGNLRNNIHPGEYYFGSEFDSLYTVLGSCVSLSVWHHRLKMGGLCHYVLPVLPIAQRFHEAVGQHPGRYAATALALMKQEMERYAPMHEYRLGLFGGSNGEGSYSVGKNNILYAQQWLAHHKLTLARVDVGGKLSRSLVFSLSTGDITVKHYAM